MADLLRRNGLIASLLIVATIVLAGCDGNDDVIRSKVGNPCNSEGAVLPPDGKPQPSYWQQKALIIRCTGGAWVVKDYYREPPPPPPITKEEKEGFFIWVLKVLGLLGLLALVAGLLARISRS